MEKTNMAECFKKNQVSTLGMSPYHYKGGVPTHMQGRSLDDALSLAWAWAIHRKKEQYFFKDYHGKFWVSHNEPDESVSRGVHWTIDEKGKCFCIESPTNYLTIN